MSNIDREAIAEAISLIEEAQELVQQAVRGNSIEANYEAYGKYGFNQLLGNGNPHDSSLYTILEQEDEEEDETIEF